MIRIVFICHGNICRSPMAEFVMKNLVQEAGLAEMFEITSRATSREEIGNDIYPPAKKILAKYNVPFSKHSANQITVSEAEYFDYLILMDTNNLRNFNRMFGDKFSHKVSLLLSFTGESRGIADPWYSGNFEETFSDVTLGCKAFLKKLGLL